SEFHQTWIDALFLGGLFAACCWYLILKPLLSSLRGERGLLFEQKRILEASLKEQHINKKLARGFGMAESETSIITFFERAVKQILPDQQVELLLADSSQAHLRLAASTVRSDSNEMNGSEKNGGNDGDAETLTLKENLVMCNVSSPMECLATQRGMPMIYKDSLDLEACPVLTKRSEHSISSVCVPINIGGRTVGLIHSDCKCADNNLESIASTFSIISTHLGTRLGLVRAMNAARQASMKDPLTGLLNRRSLEDFCEALFMSERKFSLVVTDIDHFKELNDTYSHAVGDRSLKVFANTLQKYCRSEDMVARLGGEEFCIIFLDVTADKAVEFLERVRENLSVVLNRAGLPEFTASFGVSDTNFGDSLEVLLKVADHAMYEAKQAGRNQIKAASRKSGLTPVLSKGERAIPSIPVE
ncbi:MAG: GGDEF domain-containing protein, partial [Acidobacteriota bacterium]